MKFAIIPDGDSFTVLWQDAKTGETSTTITGFATHEAAQDFIQMFMIKLVKSYARVN